MSVLKLNNFENGKLYLELPYELSKQAKSLGAKFDWDYKQWYITNINNLTSILKLYSKDYKGEYSVRVTKYIFKDPNAENIITMNSANEIEKQDSRNARKKLNENEIIECYNEYKTKNTKTYSFDTFFKKS